MALAPSLYAALLADIAVDGALAALPHNSDSADAIATAYRVIASPDFWVYRTTLGEQEIYEATSPAGTTWDWTTYIAQSAREADAWGRMFAKGPMNPSLAQARAGIDKIFAGTGAAVVAQRAHLTALYRRQATRVEKVLALGAGSTASPATMRFEGALDLNDVLHAWGQ